MVNRWRNLGAMWRVGILVIVAWPLSLCGLLLASTATAGFSSFHDPLRNLSRYPGSTGILLVMGPVMAVVMYRVFRPLRDFAQDRLFYTGQILDPRSGQRSVAIVLDRLGLQWRMETNVLVVRTPKVYAHSIFHIPAHGLEITIAGLIPRLSIGGVRPQNSGIVDRIRRELEIALG